MQSEIQRLKHIFDNNNIPVSIEWLQECSTWCKRETLSANYTIDQIKDAIHEQWLHLDLREIESPVLPTGLSEKKHMVLNGNFSLQVMRVIDISKPKYWQLQQIRKENMLTRPIRSETNDFVGTGKRVLQLTVTDGVQCVEAMEYKSISELNINLIPGIKVRISGPLAIRRGRLMLQEQNIRILGGEVEDLLVPNAAENILAKVLNLSENPNPQVVDVNLSTIEDEHASHLNRISIQQVPNTSKNQQNNYATCSNNLNECTRTNIRISEANNIQNINRYGAVVASKIQAEDYPTDEDLEMFMQAENLLESNENKCSTRNQQITTEMYINTSNSNKFLDPYDEEIKMLMEVEKELDYNQINEKMNKTNRPPDLFEDDLNLVQVDELIEMTKKTEDEILQNDIRKKSIQIETTTSIKSSNIVDLSHNDFQSNTKTPDENSNDNFCDEFISEDILLGHLDFDDLKSAKELENTSNVISITMLLQHVQDNSNGCFKVQAKFKSVVEKLTIQKEEYKLTIMIQDVNSEAICGVHSDVVSKWAGLTPLEIMNLKKTIFSQDAASKKQIEKALQNLKDRLVDVNHVMEIEINGKDCVPIIKYIFY